MSLLPRRLFLLTTLFILVLFALLLLPSFDRTALNPATSGWNIDLEGGTQVIQKSWEGVVQGWQSLGGVGENSESKGKVGKGWMNSFYSNSDYDEDDQGPPEQQDGRGPDEDDLQLPQEIGFESSSSPKEAVGDPNSPFRSNGYYIPPLSRSLAFSNSSDQYRDHRHPITTLIHSARQRWESIVSSSPYDYDFPHSSKDSPPPEYGSKAFNQSLQKAVDHYRRTQNRHPPVGFDLFHSFCLRNKVLLPHLFLPRISRDLKPFWALPRKDLLHRSRVMALERPQTFTISLNTRTGKVNIEGNERGLKRGIDLKALIEDYFGREFRELSKRGKGGEYGTSSNWREDEGDDDIDGDKLVNMTFTKHDLPAVQIGWEMKKKMEELADQGETIGPSDLVQSKDTSLSNWSKACPPNSPLAKSETETYASPPLSSSFDSTFPSQHSFIYDHRNSMDVCQHPEFMSLHGFTMTNGTPQSDLVPLFTFAKTTTQNDILVTPLEQYSDNYIGTDPEWGFKVWNKLGWRGSTTGVEFDRMHDWRNSQRARLHFMAQEKDGWKEVLSPKATTSERSSSGVEGEKDKQPSPSPFLNISLKELNQKFMDTRFSGEPVQCDKETCEELRRIVDFAPTIGLDETNQYKYLMDVDGNGWSGRFHRLMSSNSLVLKSSIFPEWYGDRIMPWVHYVPIKVDYTDLYDTMTYFVGTPDGGSEDGHDDEAAQIAAAGKEWARTFWRREDMAAYMFQLALEWARITSRTEDVSFDYVADLEDPDF